MKLLPQQFDDEHDGDEHQQSIDWRDHYDCSDDRCHDDRCSDDN